MASVSVAADRNGARVSPVCQDCGRPVSRRAHKRCRRCANLAAHGNQNGKGGRRPATSNRKGPAWCQTLTREQIETIKRIRFEVGGGHGYTRGADGWTVYLVPTTLPARYCELRHHLIEGGIARWVIERDGSVSSDNDRGALSALRETA